MKKFQILVAVALLAVAGTSLAVTCAQDHVPGATLLVPYFKVSRNGNTDFSDLQGGPGTTETMVAITNVSKAGVIAHVTLWTKYSVAVLDFNVPMTGYDVVKFYMRDILNGKLNVAGQDVDLCLPENASIGGFAQTTFQRFTNPDDSRNGDRALSTALYKPVAFSGAFRQQVWASLDESGDISSLSTLGTNVVDTTNYACNTAHSTSTLAGDFSGYLTIDVVNYCTNWFPGDAGSWVADAVATTGWDPNNGPNVLMGDVFYIDSNPTSGNISGDPAVSLEFDSRIVWGTAATSGDKSFYGRYYTTADTGVPSKPDGSAADYSAVFAFVGDGREPLGLSYGFRYLWDGATTNPSQRTWATIWRSSKFEAATFPNKDLCTWYKSSAKATGGGFVDGQNGVNISIYDNDENKYTTTTSGGPSGYVPPTIGKYFFLETQRIVVTPNTDFVPVSDTNGDWGLGGWISTNFNVSSHPFQAQAWVGVQHSGVGLAVSVGHAATLLDNQFQCVPATGVFLQDGNVISR